MDLTEHPGTNGAGELLRSDHARLDKIFDALLASYESNDWEEVRAQWDVFESSLLDHMAAEERYIFPKFRNAHLTETHALLVEHAEMRSLLATLGVAIDLHAVRSNVANDLIERLRAHAARENVLLYPWAEAKLRTQDLRLAHHT